MSKPRLYMSLLAYCEGIWFCEGDGILVGSETPRDAYDFWLEKRVDRGH